jgi:2-keto-4-pentenoate hydratase/2-oxohepta-3-ene-1,7-dioic acid hydratase in catechol pathway
MFAGVPYFACKLLRFGPAFEEQPGVWLCAEERAVDVSSLTHDFDEKFFASGGLERLLEGLPRSVDGLPEVDLAHVRLGPPIARPSKILGIGLNFRAHALETGAQVPTDPKLFMKSSSAISGCFDTLELPVGSSQTDYEVELALVMKRAARRVSVQEALEYVAGYLICNDYSERDWQKNRHGQFVKGKSADGFAPLGPMMVPADQLDPSDLRLWLSVNGEMRQDSRTSDMVFDCAELVSRISYYMTLLPGDVITTGTPSGVGLGMTPPVFLRPGDVVRYGIEGIGEAEQVVVQAPSERI